MEDKKVEAKLHHHCSKQGGRWKKKHRGRGNGLKTTHKHNDFHWIISISKLQFIDYYLPKLSEQKNVLIRLLKPRRSTNSFRHVHLNLYCLWSTFWEDWIKGIVKLSRINPLGNVNVSTKCHSFTANCFSDSERASVVLHSIIFPTDYNTPYIEWIF